MAHALVQAGVEVSGVAENGRMPLQLAVVKRNKAAQKLLAD